MVNTKEIQVESLLYTNNISIYILFCIEPILFTNRKV